MRKKIGTRFLIDGGDGDPSYLGSPMMLESVHEPWFSGQLAGVDALLFRITNEPRAGEYVAVTARHVGVLSEQLLQHASAAVYVHPIRHPGAGFSADIDANPAIGIASLDAL